MMRTEVIMMKKTELENIIKELLQNCDDKALFAIKETLKNAVNHQFYQNNVAKELADNFNPTQCPKCHDTHIVRFGKDKKGHQRYRCKKCGKTFSEITGTLLYYSKKSPCQWYDFIESLFHQDQLKKSAEIAGICEQTSFVWRHKINAVCHYLTCQDSILSDTVYIDETLNDISNPGKTITSESKKKRK